MEGLYRCLFTTKSFRRRRRRRLPQTTPRLLCCQLLLLVVLVCLGNPLVAAMEDNLASFDSNLGELVSFFISATSHWSGDVGGNRPTTKTTTTTTTINRTESNVSLPFPRFFRLLLLVSFVRSPHKHTQQQRQQQSSEPTWKRALRRCSAKWRTVRRRRPSEAFRTMCRPW